MGAPHGYDELIVKTKNKFYTMRATLDHLRFDVIKFEPHARTRRNRRFI